MVIVDKKGEVYKLRGPNPLMSTQQEWDKSKMRLINIGNWNSEVVEQPPNVASLSPPKPQVPKPQAIHVSAQDFIKEIQTDPEPEPLVQVEPEPTNCRK